MRTLPGILVLVLMTPALAQYGDISDVKLAKPEDKEDVKSVPPPEGAIVLFDGKNLDNWVQRKDGKSPATWELTPGGAMQVQVKSGDIHTKQMFDGSFKLHIEFRVPYQPKAGGQARGNSGVYLQGRYEVQILDSYGLPATDHDCGGIYEVAVPKVNACKAPTVWQSYDIDFTAPKFADGKRVEPARMTVVHNGVKIHEDVKIPKNFTRSGMETDPSTPGPIMLQDHGDPVQYRSIWVVVR
jgi:hypothetical protein